MTVALLGVLLALHILLSALPARGRGDACPGHDRGCTFLRAGPKAAIMVVRARPEASEERSTRRWWPLVIRSPADGASPATRASDAKRVPSGPAHRVGPDGADRAFRDRPVPAARGARGRRDRPSSDESRWSLATLNGAAVATGLAVLAEFAHATQHRRLAGVAGERRRYVQVTLADAALADATARRTPTRWPCWSPPARPDRPDILSTTVPSTRTGPIRLAHASPTPSDVAAAEHKDADEQNVPGEHKDGDCGAPYDEAPPAGPVKNQQRSWVPGTHSVSARGLMSGWRM